MSRLTQAAINEYLQDAAASNGRIKVYFNHLGFSKLDASKRPAGPPKFSGVIKQFYEAIKAAAQRLSQRYDSLEEFQNDVKTQENFTKRLIDDVIEQYGPDIWNDGKSGFVTIIDDEDDDKGVYPRHLIYNNESDRVRIRTFVYCFALKRIRNEITTRGPIVERLHVPAPDPPSVEPTRIVPTTSASPIPGESRSLQGASEYEAPVAQMFSIANTGGDSSSSIIPQSKIGGASLMTGNNSIATGYYNQPNEKLHRNGLQMVMETNSFHQATIKNSRQRDETGEDLPLRKRRKSMQGAVSDVNIDSDPLHLSDFTGRSTRPKRGLVVNISPSTSPNTTPEIINNSADQRSEDISFYGTTRHNASGMPPVRGQSCVDTNMNIESDDDPIAFTTVRIGNTDPDENMPNGSVDEADSVMGSRRSSPTMEEQDEDNESTLVVKLKYQSKEVVRQRQWYRRLLPVKLSKFFEMSSEQPKELGEVVKIIKEIRKLDTPLTQSGSSGRHAPYQLILDQWLELVDIYLRFRNTIDSDNDQRTWNRPRDSNEGTQRFKAIHDVSMTRLELLEWTFKHKNFESYNWSKCAIIELLDIADWGGHLTTEDREEMRERFVKFNETLVKC